jgi:hypothetical protein
MAPTYELYSWQGPNGAWNFSLFDTTDRQKTVKEVFNKKTALHGLEELKRKVSELPRGSTIVWFDRLTLSGAKVKGSEGLKYPGKEIIEELQRYADSRDIEIVGPEHAAGQGLVAQVRTLKSLSS